MNFTTTPLFLLFLLCAILAMEREQRSGQSQGTSSSGEEGTQSPSAHRLTATTQQQRGTPSQHFAAQSTLHTQQPSASHQRFQFPLPSTSVSSVRLPIPYATPELGQQHIAPQPLPSTLVTRVDPSQKSQKEKVTTLKKISDMLKSKRIVENRIKELGGSDSEMTNWRNTLNLLERELESQASAHPEIYDYAYNTGQPQQQSASAHPEIYDYAYNTGQPQQQSEGEQLSMQNARDLIISKINKHEHIVKTKNVSMPQRRASLVALSKYKKRITEIDAGFGTGKFHLNTSEKKSMRKVKNYQNALQAALNETEVSNKHIRSTTSEEKKRIYELINERKKTEQIRAEFSQINYGTLLKIIQGYKQSDDYKNQRLNAQFGSNSPMAPSVHRSPDPTAQLPQTPGTPTYSMSALFNAASPSQVEQELVGAPSNYQLAPLPQSLPSRHLQTGAQPAEHTTSVDPFGHLDLGETINYAQQAINWRERLEIERDHLIHSSTGMGEYSSRLQQLGNLEQQINQSNMLVQSLSARAELLSNRTAGPSYRQNIASTYAYGQSSQHNAGRMAQQFPSRQNTQTMPPIQVDPSQLYNLPGDASFSALLAPSSSMPAIHPNMPSTSNFHHTTRTSSGQLAPSNVVAVPAFPSNMPSSSALHRLTQPSVSQMVRTAQANMGGQGATHYTQPASGSGVYRGDPSSHRGVQHHYSNQPLHRETSYGGILPNVGQGSSGLIIPSQQRTTEPSSHHGALPEHLRQPLPWESASRGHSPSLFQPPSTLLSSANYNNAVVAPSSSRNNQINTLQPIISSLHNRTLNPAQVASIMAHQSHATSGRVNPGPSAAAPSRASSSEGGMNFHKQNM